MCIIKVAKICKTYHKDGYFINVLNDISICFSEGVVYAIKGESGAGKSTFLKTLSLLCNIDSGSILINKKNLLELSDDEISKIRNKEFGIVFQDYNLLPNLKSIDNVIVPLLLDYNFSIEEDREKAKEKLNYVGLGDRINHYPYELSGGEQQRVAIARALINDPQIILADEPTGNLDSKSKLNILTIFQKIAKSGKCVIIVTHDNEVLKIADVIYTLEEGKLKKSEKKN